MNGIGIPIPWGIVPAERLIRVGVGPDPAAGAEFQVVVPGGVVWIAQTLTTRLATSAVVANRRPELFLDDGTTEFARIPMPFDLTANTNQRITWAVNLGVQLSAGSGNFRASPMPEVAMLAGWRYSSLTEGLDAGDNYEAPALYVWEYTIRGIERAVERYEREVAEAIAAPG